MSGWRWCVNGGGFEDGEAGSFGWVGDDLILVFVCYCENDKSVLTFQI